MGKSTTVSCGLVIAVSLLPDAAPADVRATRRGTRHAELPWEDSHKQLWPICACRACHVRCSPGSRSALASGSQVAAGGDRWLLMAVRGHLGGPPTGLAWTGLHGDELQPKLQSAESMNIKLLVVVEGMALQFDHAYTDPWTVPRIGKPWSSRKRTNSPPDATSGIQESPPGRTSKLAGGLSRVQNRAKPPAPLGSSRPSTAQAPRRPGYGSVTY